MPWQNNGDYYNFKQDSIALHAPTVSGVYGLFNFRHQIVIGSAANVRNALLHHRHHTNFRFSRFEPSGFTFEICPPERRESRAQELIKEYNPISSPQCPIGISTLWRSWRASESRAFKLEVTAKRKPDGAKLRAKSAKAKLPFHLNAKKFGLAGGLCGIFFLAIGLIGLVPHLKNIFDNVVRKPTAIAESRRQIDGANIQLPQANNLSPAESIGNMVAATTPGAVSQSDSTSQNSDAAPSAPTGWRSADAQTALSAPVAAPQPQTAANAQASKREVPGKGWSVQAMATTDKQLANDWMQKLKAKGYEAFIVDADINGKTWQRVRIGTFQTRQEAESIRLALKAKEGFRDAYLAGDDKSLTHLTSNRR